MKPALPVSSWRLALGGACLRRSWMRLKQWQFVPVSRMADALKDSQLGQALDG